MRFFTLFIVLLSLTPADAVGRPRRSPLPTPKRFREGELVVKFKESIASSPSFKMGLLARGAIVKKTLGRASLVKLAVEGKSVEEAVAELEQSGEVEFAQPNYIYRASATPNDPQYSALWAFKNTGQTITSADYSTNNPGLAGKDIDAETAWSMQTDCSSVTVAVLDTGVNYNHSDLAANVWSSGSYPNHGYDFVDNDNDPMDFNGHGTHVAGIIGAQGNNGVGTTGVCWRAKLMAVRVLDASGSGTTADIVDGVNFAVAQGAKVLNLSLGQASYDAALYSALNSASAQGAVIVSAAGNDGANNESTAVYPCNYSVSNLICVAALDQAGQLATFSNYGSTSVDVGAPGTNVLSLSAGTFTTITDSFSGWTASNWFTGSRTLGDGNTYAMLMNPSGWNRSSAKYSNNLDARAYKAFNLAGASAATLDFYAFVDTQSGDTFSIGQRTSSGDPFASGSTLDQMSGTTDGYAEFFSYDLKSCLVSSCSVGFRLSTNASTVDYGVAILEFSVTKLTIGNTSYEKMSGTSMATPVVSGIAALVMAYNPSYTAADVVQALKAGGTDNSSLAGKSTSGKAVSASGSLKYIAPPTGISVTAR